MAHKDPEQHALYLREWRRKKREEVLAGQVCAVCGTSENLEIDHVDPSTKVTDQLFSISEERRNEELAKCQFLCKEHHKAKTYAELSALFTKKIHGTYVMYRNHGCRCEVCKAFKHEEYLRSKAKQTDK